MRLGVFGGTFDPPHIGHLIAAEETRVRLDLDSVIFIPSAVSPHKRDRPLSGAERRLAMLRLAVEGNDRFAVSDIEVQRGGISYTVDTLEDLKLRYPAEQLFLLIGADNLGELHLWRNPDRILQLATVVVMTRPGFPGDTAESALGKSVLMCPVPPIGIASREIRERIGRGESVRYLVPDRVAEYIMEHDMYRSYSEDAWTSGH